MTKEDFCQEEYRDGYLVNTKMKKIWYTELGLYEEFYRFCKENDLTFFAFYGTLLGAVRHKGFIPWDDDMDFMMPRPDYMRMLELAPSFFKDPVYFQSYHSDPGASAIYNFARIRDERTTRLSAKVEETTRDHPGIYIDVFPLDVVPSHRVITDRPEGFFDIMLDIWFAASDPGYVIRDLIGGREPAAGLDTIVDILGMPLEERLTLYENLLTDAYPKYDTVNFFTSMYYIEPYHKEWYSEIIEMPYEYLSIPVPAGYDQILTTCFGDYMTPVIWSKDDGTKFVDPDNPYTDYVL